MGTPTGASGAAIELGHVAYHRDGTTVLDDVSLTVGYGEQWALLGPNGAGKSTLLNLCVS